ncbi:MAG: hypothetical protein V8S98_00385 [Lachnospiraceae bacterium]
MGNKQYAGAGGSAGEVYAGGYIGFGFSIRSRFLRLGKEFDLLQVKENQIVNIELKSGAVSEDAIRRQLIRTGTICRSLEDRDRS